MRYAWIETVIKEANSKKNIWLLTGDVGFTVLEPFAEKFPERYLNVGVAEQNMMGIASGLAMEGNIVFVYTIAPFLVRRAYEFIHNDIAAHRLPVIIVGMGAGLAFGHAGPSHFAVEDIALMRTIPDMTIFTPADPVETIWATREAINMRQSVYLRLGKKGEPTLFSASQRFSRGRGITISQGKDVLVLSCGVILPEVRQATRLLQEKDIYPTVVSLSTVKPMDNAYICQLALKYRVLVTIEEHSIVGGLGSAIAEILAHQGTAPPLLSLGISDTFVRTVGSQKFLRQIYGLSAKTIADRIEVFTLNHD